MEGDTYTGLNLSINPELNQILNLEVIDKSIILLLCHIQTLYYKDLNLPLIAAPLFLISGPKLVIECCKNGVVGTFPALNQRTSEGFEEWVIQIKDELADYEKKTGIKLHHLV